MSAETKTVPLSSIGRLAKGRGLAKTDLRKEGIPCLRYAEIYTSYGCVIYDLASRADPTAAASALALHSGDIVFVASGETVEEIGMAVAYVGEAQAVVGGDTIVLKDHRQDPIFLVHALNSESAVRQKIKAGKGHSVVHIHASEIEKLRIWLPPLPDQQRIAAILDTWDKAIAIAERQGGPLARAKAGLGATIIHAGDDIALVDMADMSFSSVDKHIIDGERSVRLCNYMDVLRNRRITDGLPFSKGTATEVEFARFRLRRDDVIFTKDSETAEEIAEAAYVANDLTNVVCGYHLAFARPKQGYSGAYISHAMRVPRLRQQFVIRANGAVRFGLTLDAVKEVRLPAPSFERQLAVAAALDAAEDEAASYRTMAILLRRQKRGLMQKLLTGEWRVPARGDPFVPGGPAADRIAEAAA